MIYLYLSICLFRSNSFDLCSIQTKDFFFFNRGFLSRTLTNHRTVYSTLTLPPAHEHSDTYLQLCMWDDYHIFLNTLLVFTRLLLGEIYHLIELPFDWLMIWHRICLITCWFDSSFFLTAIWDRKPVASNLH